jgi:hypothetical protein
VLAGVWLEPAVADVSPNLGASASQPFGKTTPSLHPIPMKVKESIPEEHDMEMSVMSEVSTPSEFEGPELEVEQENVSNPIPQVPVESTREFAYLKRYINVLHSLSSNEREQIAHLTTASVNEVAYKLILAKSIKTRGDLIAGNVACPGDSITVGPALLEADHLTDSAGNSLLERGARDSGDSLFASWGFDPTKVPTGAEPQQIGLDTPPDIWARRGMKHWSHQRSLPEGVFLAP